MWRRPSPQLRALAAARWRSSPAAADAVASFHSAAAPSPFRRTSPLLSSPESSGSAPSLKKVEDVMPIATGLEREEIAAELEGKKRFDMDAPEGPFGTKDDQSFIGAREKRDKEAPAVIQSFYDKRIVGCPGGEGEDEHDVVWFWLEKGKPHECPVCSQYFVLEVVGPGGPPDGHGDDDHH